MGQPANDQTEARPAAELPRRYRVEDLHLWTATDAAHEDLTGPAPRRILHRKHKVLDKGEYQRLSQIP